MDVYRPENKEAIQLAKELARKLRKQQTPEENLLWQQLRNRKLAGLKFYRQHPIHFRQSDKDAFFVADFYCSTPSFIIELDGPIHKHRKEYDSVRDEVLIAAGCSILRIQNKEIFSDIDGVLVRIATIANQLLNDK